ncbi:MAG: hypothetical protein MUF54_22900 [Polyangiaceae bacterium]|nr:hypothetical protein [Polyangiaceae bacterium]
MMLEPIPALTGMLMAARSARFQDASLTSGIEGLEARVRATKSGETASWISIYEEALGLIERMVSAVNSSAAAPQAGVNVAVLRDVSSNLQDALNRSAADWRARLVTQEQELLQKVERSVKNLPIASELDVASGETVFTVNAEQMVWFRGWLDRAAEEWLAHDAKLVKQRADESVIPLLREAQAEVGTVRFEVSVPSLKLPPLQVLEAPRVQTLMPSAFGVVGKTYKAVVSGLMGVMALSFTMQRLVSNPSFKSGLLAALPYAAGVAVVGVVLYGLVTVPKQHRQTCARIARAAEDRVRKDLTTSALQRLRAVREALDAGVKKHLSDEVFRWKRTVRGSSPDVRAEMPSSPLLPAKTLERLRGEWREAIRGRLGLLRGSAGAGGALGPRVG